MKTIPANKRNPRICESCGQHRATRSVFFDAIDNGNGDAWPAVAYALCDPCGEFSDSLRGITTSHPMDVTL